MQKLAQGWLVLQLTDSPVALGTVLALQALPVLLFSLIGGVLADRLPKRNFMLATQALLGFQALALGILTATGRVQLWHVYVLATVLGLANALDNPTRQVIVMELIGPADVSNAVTLKSTLFNTTRIFGPAIGGVVIAALGLPACFLANAVSFLPIMALLLAMRPSEAYAVPPARGYVLDVGPLGLGWLFTFTGIGSVVAGLIQAARRESGESALLAGGNAYSMVLALIALSTWLPQTLVLLMLLGGASVLFSATASTRLQLLAPPRSAVV
jgi:MFS family permease